MASFQQSHLGEKISNLSSDATALLAEDVDQMEDSLLMHKQKLAENGSGRSTIRKEIGGSIWQYGSEGKVTSYTSSRDLRDKYGLGISQPHDNTNNMKGKPSKIKQKDLNVGQDTSNSKSVPKKHPLKLQSQTHSKSSTAPGTKYGKNHNAEKKSKHKRGKSVEIHLPDDADSRNLHAVGSVMGFHTPFNGKTHRLPPVKRHKTNSESDGSPKIPVKGIFDFDLSSSCMSDTKDMYDDIFDKKAKLLEKMIGTINLQSKEKTVSLSSDTEKMQDVTSNSRLSDSEVEQWLRSLRLQDVDKYIDIFAENEIDMETAIHLTEKQLKEMGIVALGAVTKIVRSIRELRRTQSRQGKRWHPTTIQPSVSKVSTPGKNVKKNDKVNSTNANDKAKYNESDDQDVEKYEKGNSFMKSPDSQISEKRDYPKPLLSSMSKSVAKLFTPRAELEKEALDEIQMPPSMYNTACCRVKQIPSRSDNFRSLSRLQGVPEEDFEKWRFRPTSEMRNAPEQKTSPVTDAHQESLPKSSRTQSALPSVRADVTSSMSPSTKKTTDTTLENEEAEKMVHMKQISPHPFIQEVPENVNFKELETEIKSLLLELDLSDPNALLKIEILQKQLKVVQSQILENNRARDKASPKEKPSPKDKPSPKSPLTVVPPLNLLNSDDSPHVDKESSPIPFTKPSPLPKIFKEELSPHLHSAKSNNSISKAGVVSQAMTKEELLKEVRRQKDEHRKQIRHLEGELSRLKHKDPLRNCEIKESDVSYNDSNLLGEGGFSQVFKGQYQGNEVAIKRLKLPLSAQDKNYFSAEVKLLKELRHPRVALMIGVCTNGELPLMVFEYMSQGSLYNYLHDKNKDALDHAAFYQIARDIALGMNYLHLHRPIVLHLDLKSMNILLTSHLRAKIADFGFSKLRQDCEKSKHVLCGTPGWMAPEMLENGQCTTKADVYSFSIILWEMLTRQHPYSGCTFFQVIEKVRKKQRPEIPENCPMGLEFLMRRCWDPNPAKRPPFKEVLPTLEDLYFPPEWRNLFNSAGVPQVALNDIESTRTLINIVSKSLDQMTRPTDVPSLELCDSEDEKEQNTSGRLKNMDWETDSDSEESELDEDFKQLQEEVKEAAAQYRGVVGTSRNAPKTPSDTINLSRLMLNDGLPVTSRSDKDHLINRILADSNNHSHRDSYSRVGYPSHRDDNDIPDDSPKRLFSTGSQSARGVPRKESNIMETLRKSLPEADGKLDNEQLAQYSSRSSVLSTQTPVPPLDMTLLVSPPPPVPPPSLPSQISVLGGKDKSVVTQTSSQNISKQSEKSARGNGANTLLINRKQEDFNLRGSLLIEQKAKLKSTAHPHPNQLKDLSALSADAVKDIAEAIRNVINTRRVAMAGDATAENSFSASGNAWSITDDV